MYIWYPQDKARNDIAAIEIAYNIVETAKKYSALDSECALFLSVLDETLPQDIWFDTCMLLESLRVSRAIHLCCMYASMQAWGLLGGVMLYVSTLLLYGITSNTSYYSSLPLPLLIPTLLDVCMYLWLYVCRWLCRRRPASTA